MSHGLIIYDFYSTIITKTLNNRKEYYKYITRYLRNNTYTVGKQIGSVSKNASVYTCTGNGPAKILKFVCKYYDSLISKSMFNDINLSIRLSALVLRDANPHFNIVYKYHNNSLLVEKAQGDLKQFIQRYHSYDLLINCLQQILICVLSFHKHTELCHGDCYHGNFLFHRLSKKGGHVHYKINGKDVYIRNMGYLWVINDFDMITEEDDDNSMYMDYIVAMETFVNYDKHERFTQVFIRVLNTIHMYRDADELFKHLDYLWALHEPKYKKNVLNKQPYIL